MLIWLGTIENERNTISICKQCLADALTALTAALVDSAEKDGNNG